MFGTVKDLCRVGHNHQNQKITKHSEERLYLKVKKEKLNKWMRVRCRK